MVNSNQICPGFFGKTVYSDVRRLEFDWKNQEILTEKSWPDLLFIGDSITQNWELEAYFGGEGLRLVNRGISGDEMQYIARRFAADAVQLRPKVCVLLAGINDSWNMDAKPELMHTGETLESTLRRTKGCFDDVIAQAKAAEMKLVLGSLLPVSSPYDGIDGMRNTYYFYFV